MSAQQGSWLRLDASQTVSVSELVTACGFSRPELEELVFYGALAPLDGGAAELVFSAEVLMPLRTAGRLRRDYDLDLFAAALLLEHRLRTLEALLPAGHPLRG